MFVEFCWSCFFSRIVVPKPPTQGPPGVTASESGDPNCADNLFHKGLLFPDGKRTGAILGLDPQECSATDVTAFNMITI